MHRLGRLAGPDPPEAKESLAELKAAGVRRVAMVSGDRQPVATRVAAEIGCEEARGECLPQNKVEFVRGVKAKGYRVAVVGDGVNDAPALAAGDIGIAMGAAGSEVAIHSATIALMNNDLRRLPFLVRLSRSTRAVINQNFLFGVLFHHWRLDVAALGYIDPIIAAILHNVGSLIVIFNSARLVRKGEELEHYHPDRGETGTARLRPIDAETGVNTCLPDLCPSPKQIRNPQIAIRKSDEVVVSVRGLTKVFKDFWSRPKARAVDNVDFDVRRGEVFGLLGPNGSGKSTTSSCCWACSIPPTATSRSLAIRPPRAHQGAHRLPARGILSLSLPRLARDAGVFRQPVPVAQGRARTAAPSNCWKWSASDRSNARRRRVFQGHAAPHRPGPGAHQRPDLVILDEPTSGLDPIGCREVKDLILALARRGKTVILSSHLLADVEDVCDRVVIYYGGRIQAMGTLKDLLATPDAIRITTPVLPRETMERVLEIIRKDVAADKVRMDTPTQNLESYFLDVVQKARQAAAETSGAISGARVAAYLRGGVEEGRRAEKILERLALPQAAQPAAAAADRGAGCRAESGRQKTGGAGQSRRTGAATGQTQARRRRKSRRIWPRRTKNSRRCWARPKT